MSVTDVLAWQRAVRDSGLPPNTRLVALTLATRFDARMQCWPSRDQIAEDTGLSPSTVKRAVKALDDAGWIERDTRRDGPGRGSATTFTGRFPAARQARGARRASAAKPATKGSQLPLGHGATKGSEKTLGRHDQGVTQAPTKGSQKTHEERTQERTYRKPSTKQETHVREDRAGNRRRVTVEDDSKAGSPDDRAIRAMRLVVDHHYRAKVEALKAKGEPIRSPGGLRETIRRDRELLDWPKALADARRGMTPREIANRLTGGGRAPSTTVEELRQAGKLARPLAERTAGGAEVAREALRAAKPAGGRRARRERRDSPAEAVDPADTPDLPAAASS